MEYKVVAEVYISELHETVSLLISKGYIPQGGVSYGSGYYIQAMIKTI
jgi:hypothetical protein